jgi:Flp pilus assembly protein TadG
MVEFALTGPILVVLLLGLMELGNGMNAYLTVLASGRDGARLGAQGSATDTEITSLVVKEAERLKNPVPASCSPGNAGVCVSHPTVGGVTSVKVEVCYDHPLIVGLAGLMPDPLTMCSTTTMRQIE